MWHQVHQCPQGVGLQHNRSILVDDPVIRHIGEYALASVRDMFVTTAVGGFEALAVVDQLQPDVILLDCMMPEMDGKEVFTALQSSPATRHIPVVFLTGLETKGHSARLDG